MVSYCRVIVWKSTGPLTLVILRDSRKPRQSYDKVKICLYTLLFWSVRNCSLFYFHKGQHYSELCPIWSRCWLAKWLIDDWRRGFCWSERRRCIEYLAVLVAVTVSAWNACTPYCEHQRCTCSIYPSKWGADSKLCDPSKSREHPGSIGERTWEAPLCTKAASLLLHQRRTEGEQHWWITERSAWMPPNLTRLRF